MIPLDRIIGGAGPAGRLSWAGISIRLPSQRAASAFRVDNVLV